MTGFNDIEEEEDLNSEDIEYDEDDKRFDEDMFQDLDGSDMDYLNGECGQSDSDDETKRREQLQRKQTR